MPEKLLLNGQWRTYDAAASNETNLLLSLQNENGSKRLNAELWTQRNTIEAIIRHHLRLDKRDDCRVLPRDSWIQGGFNTCVLVEVISGLSSRLFVFRCPMMHGFAGTELIDEKVSCEVATYVWMQEHCPTIRIPRLYAFGFAQRHFTHFEQRPVCFRICHMLRRWYYQLFRYPLLSNYLPNSTTPKINTSYMLLEYIGADQEEGKMLSETWETYRHDSGRKSRLFRGIAHVMLSLARIPQPRIGSFSFNTTDCTITLSNRPLTCAVMKFESSGTQPTTKTSHIYRNTESFVSDMLTLYDRQLLCDPHAVRDKDDAKERITIRTLLRAVAHHFIQHKSRDGPFVLQPTDLHQSNIFVDEDWNITCLIDLEWMCALPIEMLSAPSWLTSCSLDEIIDERYAKYNAVRQEFMALMDTESKKIPMEHHLQVTKIMEEIWLNKGVWFWACLRSVNAWIFIFEDHILKRFSPEADSVAHLTNCSAIWHDDIEGIVKGKVQDEEGYQARLKSLYKLSIN